MRVFKSFVHAFHGLIDCLAHERNFQIEYVIGLLVIGAGIFFSLSTVEWMAVFICIAIVLCFEIINSAIEKLCNMVSPDYNLTIKKIKDMAASAVLLASILSFIIGCMIFLPKIKLVLFG